MNVRPHVACRLRGSAIDRRTTRHPGYAASQRIRKRIEEAFGWMKTIGGMRRPMRRGTDRVGWSFIFMAAAYNLVRLPKLLVAATEGRGCVYRIQVLGATLDTLLLPTLWRAMFLPQVMPERFAAVFPFLLAGCVGQMIAEGEDAGALMPALLAMAGRYAACRVPTRFLGGTANIVVNDLGQGLIASALMPDASFH